MEKLIRLGLDTSKSVFQLHGVNAAERPVLKKRLRRKDLVRFLSKLEPTVIAIEACGGSHHWAREISTLGHTVKLIAPQHVKPYVPRGKNDAADAAGLCEALSRPSMRFVPVKSLGQQAALMLTGMRTRLIRSRTQLSNAIRGHAMEFGLVTPKGLAKIGPLLERIAAEETLPALARELFASMGREYVALQGQLKEIDAKLMTWHRENECSQRLAAVPSLGPIGATMLTMKTPEPGIYHSARHFSAWIGLTAKDHSTAGKQRLGAITRAGDPELRAVLVAGAMAVVRQVLSGRGKPSPWLENLLKRKKPKLAAVALANKTARVAWKMMMTGERYDQSRIFKAVAVAA
jgi:transposase